VRFAFGIIVATLVFGGACGYRVAGTAGRGLPPGVRTIAVPSFENQTLGFRIDQTLTAAVIHELTTRAAYRVQSGSEGSDATLSGAVTAVYSSPIVFDPASGRTTEVLLTVGMQFRLVETATGETLYESGDWVYREPYEVSRDPAAYFGENQPALERLSRQVAASLVATLLEGVE
jgi:hypothetical protein